MSLPIRRAVLQSPDYPFTPVHAPIKLDQNEAGEDFPAALKALVLERLAQLEWHRYPDLNSERLAEAIARHDGWHAAGTVVATGSNVLIAVLVQLAGLGARVLTVKPNFALYGLDAKLLGAELTELPLRDDGSMDFDALMAEVTRQPMGEGPAGVIYLPRPHAPTGALAALADMERLAKAASRWLLVVDEAYHQFAPDNATELARRYPHVLLLRTFSKAWGLAGLRLGYVLTSDAVALNLRKLVPPFACSVLQTTAACVALEHPGYMLARVAQTLCERQRVSQALRKHPRWQALPSHANFVLIRTPDAAQVYQQLLAHGVLVRRQDSYFGLAGCIRVTIGTPAQNDAFLAAAAAINASAPSSAPTGHAAPAKGLAPPC